MHSLLNSIKKEIRSVKKEKKITKRHVEMLLNHEYIYMHILFYIQSLKTHNGKIILPPS